MYKFGYVIGAFVVGAFLAPLIVYLTTDGRWNLVDASSNGPNDGRSCIFIAFSLGGGLASALYISSLDIRQKADDNLVNYIPIDFRQKADDKLLDYIPIE